MRETKDVLIIIPAYNEEENIGSLLEQLKTAGIPEFADILVMDDASGDRTAQVVREAGVSCISHVFHLGYGSGLQVGYNYAKENAYSYVIQMDADGQHDVCNIEPLYHALREADADGKTPDIVIGSRFLDPRKAEGKEGAAKHFARLLFRKVISAAAGQTVTDPTSGLQGLSQRAFSYYSEPGNFDDQYPDANMILQMLLLGFSIREIPAVMHERKHGKSMHSGLKPVIYMGRMFFSMIAVWLRCRLA